MSPRNREKSAPGTGGTEGGNHKSQRETTATRRELQARNAQIARVRVVDHERFRESLAPHFQKGGKP